MGRAGVTAGGAASPHPLLPAELQRTYRERRDWEDRTLAEIVRDWAERDPARLAITGPQPFTYEELWRASRRLAGTLADRVAPGEFVLAVLSNSWQGIALSVAGSIAGVGLAPLSARVAPTLALNVAEQVGVRGVVLQAGLLEREGWEDAVAALRERVGDGPVLLTDGTFEEAARSGREIDQRGWDPGRGCLVLSTGGTTGRPKSVLLYENALVWAAREMCVACEFTERDVHVAFGPYGHASGSLFEIYMPLLVGAASLPIARWRPLPVAEAIAAYGGTYCITVGNAHVRPARARGGRGAAARVDAAHPLRRRPRPSLRGRRAAFRHPDRALLRPVRVHGSRRLAGARPAREAPSLRRSRLSGRRVPHRRPAQRRSRCSRAPRGSICAEPPRSSWATSGSRS